MYSTRNNLISTGLVPRSSASKEVLFCFDTSTALLRGSSLFSTGLNYVEIGHLLNRNPDTVKKQVYRTLDHLRGKYGTQLMELLMIFAKWGRR